MPAKSSRAKAKPAAKPAAKPKRSTRSKPARQSPAELVPAGVIERRILFLRHQKVLLDSDLAALYQTTTKALNLAVRRNRLRFPPDFMFQLSPSEASSLRFQFETSNSSRRGGRRYLPSAFPEQRIAMLSSVLNSDRAVLVNIAIMRAFVKLREVMASHADLAQKIEALEHKYASHDEAIQTVFRAIRDLLDPPIPAKRRIGFRAA